MAKGFLILISFFTRIPIGNKVEFNEESYVKGLCLYSLIGAVIGFFLAIIYLNFNNIMLIRGLLITIGYIIITGGIHLDGTADTSDGIFSGRTGDKIFEIMSDPHIGSFGVVSLILVVFSQIILFSYSDIFTVFMMPIIGRASVIISSWNKKYAKNTKGMGTLFIESIDNNVLAINLIIVLFFMLLTPFRFIFLTSVFATLMISYFISSKIEDKIGGMTGDTCGFILEISQIIFMMITLFIKG